MLNLLREDVTSSFSDLWYRIGPTRPRLSPHAQVIRQLFGAETSYIIEDPAGGQYYRLTESAYFFVGLLDGRRSVDQAWEACNSQLGDAAPTQRECVELLSKLQLYGLLAGDLPLAADMVELRRTEARSRSIQRRTGRGVTMTIPLFNPEPYLERSRQLLGTVFSKWGAAAWLLVVAFALYRIFIKREALSDNLSGVLDPSNLFWLGVAFIFLRAWHEMGHATACKAMGARCTEMGMMVIALVLPFPYCDASAAWRLPEVWKRVIVSSGGVIVETFLAAIAAILWSFMGKDDAGLLRTLLFNTMVISGVSTLIFNLNPLMRYDGYYILSDIAGSANLAMRSQELLKFLLMRYVFRTPSARPPWVRSRTEFSLLLLYGLLSWPYRLFVVFGIVLVLWSRPTYLTLGAVLAVIAAAIWIVWPILKGAGFLLTSPNLMGRRVRALTITAGVIVAAVITIGLVPFPAAGYASGTLEPIVLEPLRTTEDGFIQQVHVHAGDSVNKGDPIVTLYNAEVMASLESARSAVEGAEVDVRAAMGSSMTDRILTETRLRQLESDLAHAQDRADSLVVRARATGHVVVAGEIGTDLDQATGQFMQKGSMLGLVASTDHLMVRCVVADRDRGYIFRGRSGENVENVAASIRVRGRAGDVIKGAITRDSPAGSRRVTGQSLTTSAGGDVVSDPSDPKKETTVAPHWVVEVTPQEETGESVATWKPGLRAMVRFDIGREPLATQWWRRIRQFIDDKAGA